MSKTNDMINCFLCQFLSSKNSSTICGTTKGNSNNNDFLILASSFLSIILSHGWVNNLKSLTFFPLAAHIHFFSLCLFLSPFSSSLFIRFLPLLGKNFLLSLRREKYFSSSSLFFLVSYFSLLVQQLSGSFFPDSFFSLPHSQPRHLDCIQRKCTRWSTWCCWWWRIRTNFYGL